MRRLAVFIISVLGILFWNSCDKENNSLTDDLNNLKVNHFPLEIGNYWIYQNFDIIQGIEKVSTKIDSVIISRDTSINGKTYYVLEGTYYPKNNNWGIIELLYDSVGYLINQHGEILFSEDNFTDILANKTEVQGTDTIYSLTYKMEEVENPYSVPAGTFNVLNYKGTVFTFVQTMPNVPNPRYTNAYFAENVGKIFESFFYLYSNSEIEKRLLRYHIK